MPARKPRTRGFAARGSARRESRDTRTRAQDLVHVPIRINIETSCARPQGGRKAASPRHADTRLCRAQLCRDTRRLRRARLCRDTRTRAQDRVHVPTTINIEIQCCFGHTTQSPAASAVTNPVIDWFQTARMFRLRTTKPTFSSLHHDLAEPRVYASSTLHP